MPKRRENNWRRKETGTFFLFPEIFLFSEANMSRNIHSAQGKNLLVFKYSGCLGE